MRTIFRNEAKFARLQQLLKDYGYSYNSERGQLIENGVRGFTSAKALPYKFRDIYGAVEHLIPRIAQDEFSDKYNKICKEQ